MQNESSCKENEVIVVIPTYKENLLPSEQVSLNQAYNILHKYPICFMAPNRMKSFLTNKNLAAEYFDDEYFLNRIGYSKLLLSPEFYQRFSNYKYMLIYQLDAFVFYDRLEYFCSLDYDYIGAPLPIVKAVPTMVNTTTKYKEIVGNGGLSLRKISSFIKVTKDILNNSILLGCEDVWPRSQDMFFSYCGMNDSINFSTPNAELAGTFAFQYNAVNYKKRFSNDNLPFGCHAWSLPEQFIMWQPHIEKFLISNEVVKELEKEIYINVKTDARTIICGFLVKYLTYRVMRGNNEKGIFVMDKIIPANDNYILWGNGNISQRAQRLLKFLNKSIQNNEVQSNIPIKTPDIQWTISNNCKIIVAVKNKLSEICEELQKYKLKENIHFFIYTDIEKKFFMEYYKDIWFKIKQK